MNKNPYYRFHSIFIIIATVIEIVILKKIFRCIGIL